MKKIRILTLLIGVCLCFSAMPAEAQGIWGACGGSNAGSAICADKTEASSVVTTLINTFLFVIGILSVIMIIHSGFKYINSRGDAEGVKNAKNTLLYSVTGLIVAMMAFVIVNFVVGIFLQSGTPTTQTSTISDGGLS